jgi:hypothetical protein
MTANLSWTAPGVGGSSGQDIQYKLRSSSTWITYTTVPGDVNSIVIPGLLDNRIYDFQIVNHCQHSGTTTSVLDSIAKVTCPALTVTTTASQVAVSFTHLGGDITKYTVQLLAADRLTLVATQDVTVFSTPNNVYFNGLPPHTAYFVNIIPIIVDIPSNYVGTCLSVHYDTAGAPNCPQPTGVVSSMAMVVTPPSPIVISGTINGTLGNVTGPVTMTVTFGSATPAPIILSWGFDWTVTAGGYQSHSQGYPVPRTFTAGGDFCGGSTIGSSLTIPQGTTSISFTSICGESSSSFGFISKLVWWGITLPSGYALAITPTRSDLKFELRP